MRIRTILLAFALVIAAPGFTQNYNGFNYQAVIRNAAGDPLPNQAVGVRVQINPGIAAGYSETHSVTTDAHGLISLTMGQGTPEVGSVIPTFSALDWTSSVMNYTVSVDITGGTNYAVLGGAAFKAVPFAMHALTSGSGASGWSLLGNDLSNTNTGNVCIGTTTPYFKLQVEATSLDGVASFRNTDPNGASKIEFYDDVEPLYPFLSIGKGNSGTGALPGSSHISSTNRLTLGTQGNPNLVIEPTGEMGFNAPSAALTTATFGGIGRSLSLLTGNGEDIVWDGGGTGEVILKNTGTLSGATAFQNASSVALMTLRNTGEVGIGTSSPGGPFETHKADGSFVVRSWAGSGSNVVVTDVVGRNNFRPQQRFSTVGNSNYFDIGLGADDAYHIESTGDVPRISILQNGNVGIGTASPGNARLLLNHVTSSISSPAMKIEMAGANLLFYKASNGAATIDNTSGGNLVLMPAGGNVGIGTITPQSKLAVNGKITCKEVEVTLAGFPDYVFEKDYRLMPLDEVERYIAAYGHLPNVPSACEVEENGLGLGAMNKILLEKVEELTLHAIAKEKEVEALNARVAQMEAILMGEK